MQEEHFSSSVLFSSNLIDGSPSFLLLIFSAASCNTLLRILRNIINALQQRILQRVIPPSQVPQPTCSWKWVGCTIPLKQANLTLEASWGFNMARTGEKVQLLEWSGYLKQLFNWRTLHTCIGCAATAAWRAPPIWKFGTANLEVHHWCFSSVGFLTYWAFHISELTFLAPILV